ncbi:MAG: AMP-binding protein [Proteobacteria bacterium]|nr:AMP-binding protein [Pseudomonadota bacterium]
MGRDRAARALSLKSFFDRDLGIDSLGRVELFHRIEENFHIDLPESLMASAQNLADLVAAIKEAKPSQVFFKQVKVLDVTQTTYDPSTAQTLVEVLIKRANKEGERPHIYLQDETGAEKIITYAQLYQQAQKIAAGLLEYKIEPLDTIAIMLPTCEDFFYVFFGILLLGAIPVPIYPPFRPDKIEEYAFREANILRNANARLLITFHQAERLSELLSVFISSLKAVVTVDQLDKSNNKVPHLNIKGEMPALIQYTSGSTSLPKGVLLTHQNLLANIRATGQAIEINPADVGASWLPLYHDMGLIGAWLISFYHANPVVIMSPITFLTKPERWLWAIHYHRATLTAAPNFAYELCIRRIKPENITGLDISSWRLSFNGAEAVNPNTIERFLKTFSPYGFKAQTMFPVYGLAESTVALTLPAINRAPIIDKVNRTLFETEQRAVPAAENESHALKFVCCGKPIPGHEIRIVDDKDNPVPERKIGHLHFKGPSTMQGYYNQPQATAAITHDDWMDTGDLAYIADGELYITGRKKDTIIKAGRNLYPEEIEEATGQVSGVRKGCVVAFGVEDNKTGTEKLIIVVETKEKKQAIRKQIVQEINEKITVVLGIVADDVILVPPKTVPKTSSGKLQRAACKQAFLEKKLLKPLLPVWLQIIKIFFKSAAFKARQHLNTAFRFLYSLYVAFILFSHGILIWLGCLLFSQKWAAKWVKCLARVAITLMGLALHIENKQWLVADKTMLFVANHASYLDAVVLIAVLPAGVRFVGKKELMKVPFLKTILKKLDMIVVDRVDFLANIADTQIIKKHIEAKESICIFPEGTFTYATGLRPFKLGAFKVAVETTTSICPIALQGTRHVLRDDELLFRLGSLKVVVGENLVPQSAQWQEVIRLHAQARAFIAQNCNEQVIDY